MYKVLVGVFLLAFCLCANANTQQRESRKASIAEKIQVLKQQAVILHKDLAQLEQDLIYPSTTQVAVYLSKKLHEKFKFSHVSLLIDNVPVASYVYSNDENKALELGAMQRLYMGNINVGEHVFEAVVKLVDENDNISTIQGQSSYYKDSNQQSLNITVLNTDDNKDPILSVIRL